MIDSGGWYLNASRRNRPVGFVYAVTRASSPSSDLNWRSVYGDNPNVKIDKI